MEIEVEIRGDIKKVDINKGATWEELLEKLSFFPDNVLVIVNNKPVTHKDQITETKAKIIQVVSGG